MSHIVTSQPKCYHPCYFFNIKLHPWTCLNLALGDHLWLSKQWTCSYTFNLQTQISICFLSSLTDEEQQLQCAHLEQEVQHLRNEVENHQCRSEALETALRSTQTRSQQLWTELQRKRAYVEKVERLQGALTQLQATCEKREGLETRLRTRLEQELRSLRNQQVLRRRLLFVFNCSDVS